MKKPNIEWTLLAKAVGITAALAAVLTLIAFLVKYAPWVLAAFAAALVVTCVYFTLKCLED